jgi:hypothetical protein
MRSNNLPGFLTWYDGDDFERCARPSPLEDPFLEEPQVVATHYLKATGEIGLHPAIYVLQPVREGTPTIPQTLVNRNHIVFAKSLDDHKQHVQLPCGGRP